MDIGNAIRTERDVERLREDAHKAGQETNGHIGYALRRLVDWVYSLHLKTNDTAAVAKDGHVGLMNWLKDIDDKLRDIQERLRRLEQSK